jgi:ABC-type sugar transport system permease subunit
MRSADSAHSLYRSSPWVRRVRHFLNPEMNQSVLALVLIMPSVVLALGLILWPIVKTLILSFHFSLLSHPERQKYIGLKNYTNYLDNPLFWASIKRTTYFTFVSVGVELVLGILIALLLAQKLRGWRFLRVAIIIPWAIPTVVNGALWRWIFHADYGALNGLLLNLGLIHRYVPWLADPQRAMNLVIVADVWHSAPFVVLIVSAAMAGLPIDLYDAASIDGANALQRFTRITLPLLRPAIMVVLVVRTVEAFRVFDIVYIMTRGGPSDGTLVISYLTYQDTFSYLKLGSGSALSFIVSAFVLLLALIYIRILYTEDVVG